MFFDKWLRGGGKKSTFNNQFSINNIQRGREKRVVVLRMPSFSAQLREMASFCLQNSGRDFESHSE